MDEGRNSRLEHEEEVKEKMERIMKEDNRKIKNSKDRYEMRYCKLCKETTRMANHHRLADVWICDHADPNLKMSGK